MIEDRPAQADRQALAALAASYDPRARFDVDSRDVEYRHDGQRSWQARIYQPRGSGPFPTLLEVHGGAWNRFERTQNEMINTQIAASGVVIAAIDFRQATDAPYPAALQDINYGIRWLKRHAAEFGGTSVGLGGIGYSSGGHLIVLSAIRPRDPRYSALPLAEAPDLDASLEYVIAGWPVLDPHRRYHHARASGLNELLTYSERFFGDEDGMREGNPQQIVERGEPIATPPLLILMGAADVIIPRETAERFVTVYANAGGVVELGLYPGAPHGFMREPTSNQAQSIELAKSFICRQLALKAAG